MSSVPIHGPSHRLGGVDPVPLVLNLPYAHMRIEGDVPSGTTVTADSGIDNPSSTFDTNKTDLFSHQEAKHMVRVHGSGVFLLIANARVFATGAASTAPPAADSRTNRMSFAYYSDYADTPAETSNIWLATANVDMPDYIMTASDHPHAISGDYRTWAGHFYDFIKVRGGGGDRIDIGLTFTNTKGDTLTLGDAQFMLVRISEAMGTTDWFGFPL